MTAVEEKDNRMTNKYVHNKIAYIVCDYDIRRHPLYDTVMCFGYILDEIGYSYSIVDFCEVVDKKEILKDGEGLFSINIGGVKTKNHYLKRFQREKLKENNLKDLLTNGKKVDLLLYFGENCGATYRTIRAYKNKDCALVCFVGEWFDVKRLFTKEMTAKGWISSMRRLLSGEYARRVGFVKNGNLIVVSKRLESFYCSKRCNCIRIPNLLNMEKFIINENTNDKLMLGYFGTPGVHNSKDLLNVCIKGIFLLDKEERNKIEFHMYGVEEEQLYTMYDVPKEIVHELRGGIFAHGRVNKEEVRNIICNIDFTLLMRKSTRSINCGLSSKMEESMAFGIPLICNLTSDMGDYICDGKSGIVCDGEDARALKEGITRALLMSAEARRKMKFEAYKSARENFDFHAYVYVLKKYVEGIGKTR